MPADRLRQRAAGQQADRGARGGHEAVDADRLALLLGLGEHRHDHAEDHGGGQRAADALHEAGADEQLLVRGQAAGQRGRGEEREAGEEDAPTTDQVTEAAGEQQQAAERDQVAVDHPGEGRLREAEVLLDRRQRDVHDRRVEDDHHEAGAEDEQRGPASVSLWCLRGVCGGSYLGPRCTMDVVPYQCTTIVVQPNENKCPFPPKRQLIRAATRSSSRPCSTRSATRSAC